MDEAPDAIRGSLSLDFPLLQHLPGVGHARIDHSIQNFILGLEVIIKIAARDLHSVRNVRERGVLVALPVEQPIGSFNNVIAGCLVAHENACSPSRAAGGVGRSSYACVELRTVVWLGARAGKMRVRQHQYSPQIARFAVERAFADTA